jgi:4-hydroxybenzoyl-CoA reductase subunit beta
MSLLPAFDLVEPRTTEEAVALKRTHPRARFLAGGTDLIPNLRRGLDAPDVLISLGKIPEFRQFETRGDSLMIGAGVNIAELATSAFLHKDYPAISMAAASIAGPAHRGMATVGGNLCLDTRCVFYNQSKWWREANNFCLKKDGDTCHVVKKGNKCVAAYSGDLAPSLMVLEAELEIANTAGRRRRSLAGIFRDDGQAWLDLEPDDLVVAVHIPARPGVRSGYFKSRTRQSMDFPLAGVAAAMSCEGVNISRLAVAITGTNSRPVQLEGLEALTGGPLNGRLLDELGKNISHTIQPMRTTLAPSLYRRHMAGVLAKRLVTQLYEDGVCNYRSKP